MGILTGEDSHIHLHYLNSKGLRGRWCIWSRVQTGQHELGGQSIWWHLCARGHWEQIWVTHAPHESQAPTLSGKRRAFPTSLMWVAISRRKSGTRGCCDSTGLCSKPTLQGVLQGDTTNLQDRHYLSLHSINPHSLLPPHTTPMQELPDCHHTVRTVSWKIVECINVTLKYDTIHRSILYLFSFRNVRKTI